MLPNLIVIGAMKAGTTSLHHYLNLHPEVSMSREKELDFFIEERNWRRGLKWYESHFTGEARIYGESSVNYTNFPRFKNVPERMYSLVPATKLIYVIRDPIERIISHYIHSYANGRENRPFTKALSNLDPKGEYVLRSSYYKQLEQFLCFYPKSSILIITQEDLYGNRLGTLQRVFRFLGVDGAFCSAEFSSTLHRSTDKRRKSKMGRFLESAPVMKVIERLSGSREREIKRKIFFTFSQRIVRPVPDEALRNRLIEYLREDADRMRAFTGCKFENWCL